MAEFKKWTPAQEQEWSEWVASRPKVIQDMCAVYKPNVLYELKTTGQRVYLTSMNEDGTVTVQVTPEYNPHTIFADHAVFGINPSDLVETDLPAGAALME